MRMDASAFADPGYVSTGAQGNSYSKPWRTGAPMRMVCSARDGDSRIEPNSPIAESRRMWRRTIDGGPTSCCTAMISRPVGRHHCCRISKQRSCLHYLSRTSRIPQASGLSKTFSGAAGVDNHTVRWTSTVERSLRFECVAGIAAGHLAMADTRRCTICDGSVDSGDSDTCAECRELLRWFRSYFADVPKLDLLTITPETRFVDDLGADSLDYIDWVLEAESVFNIRISDHDAERMRTVADYLRRLRQDGARWLPQQDIEIEKKSWGRRDWKVINRKDRE